MRVQRGGSFGLIVRCDAALDHNLAIHYKLQQLLALKKPSPVPNALCPAVSQAEFEVLKVATMGTDAGGWDAIKKSGKIPRRALHSAHLSWIDSYPAFSPAWSVTFKQFFLTMSKACCVRTGR